MHCTILSCFNFEHYSSEKRTDEIIGTCLFFPQGITYEDTRYCNGVEDPVERKKRIQKMFPPGQHVIVED